MTSAPVCSCCEQFVSVWVTLWTHPDLLVCYECLDYLNARRDRQLAMAGGLRPTAGHDPVFRVHDVAAAAAHYRRLGFTIDVHDDTYVFAAWGGGPVIHLTVDETPGVHMTSTLYVHVEDADAVAAAWRAAGLSVVEPTDQDYGKREGRHTDPDGNVIRFGGPPRGADGVD